MLTRGVDFEFDAGTGEVRRGAVHRLEPQPATLTVVLLTGATVAIERRPNRHHEIAVAVLRSVHDRLF